MRYSGQGILLPVLPVLARSLGLSALELGLVNSASSLARILCNVPAAALAERFGRRPLLVAGPAIGAAAMVGIAVSSSFEGRLVGS